jgi:hypothetical protein
MKSDVFLRFTISFVAHTRYHMDGVGLDIHSLHIFGQGMEDGARARTLLMSGKDNEQSAEERLPCSRA